MTCGDRCVCEFCSSPVEMGRGGDGCNQSCCLLSAVCSCQGLGSLEFPCMGLECCVLSRHCSWGLAVTAESANGMPFSRG